MWVYININIFLGSPFSSSKSLKFHPNFNPSVFCVLNLFSCLLLWTWLGVLLILIISFWLSQNSFILFGELLNMLSAVEWILLLPSGTSRGQAQMQSTGRNHNASTLCRVYLLETTLKSFPNVNLPVFFPPTFLHTLELCTSKKILVLREKFP